MSTIEGHRLEDNDLFDGSQYDLPIPTLDGHKADVLRLAIGGQIDLDLYDNQALEFLNGLKLGHELACTRCSSVWDVIEPIEHIDPERYVCGDCMRPVPGQLEMVEGHQVDQREYDPDQATIPF